MMSAQDFYRRFRPQWAMIATLMFLTGTAFALYWARAAGKVLMADGATNKPVNDGYLISMLFLLLIPLGILLFSELVPQAVAMAAEAALILYLCLLIATAFNIATAIEKHVHDRYGEDFHLNRLMLFLYNFPYLGYRLSKGAKQSTRSDRIE